jgi:hypothetical protein
LYEEEQESEMNDACCRGADEKILVGNANKSFHLEGSKRREIQREGVVNWIHLAHDSSFKDGISSHREFR